MKKVLIVGGRGFVGSSLIDSWLRKSDYQLTGTTRHNTHKIYESPIEFVKWNILEKSTLIPNYDVIINCAVPASAELNVSSPELMMEVNIQGMRNILEFAAAHDKPPIVLLTSSGAVYGEMPKELDRFYEDSKADHSLKGLSAYAKGKLIAEELLQLGTSDGVCVGLTARMFAFCGVHLPLDRHFALGNFVRDAIESREIVVRSDGSSTRSYMDATDMSEWILRITEVGSSDHIYHVGSERNITILELANLVASRYEMITGLPVRVRTLNEKSLLDGVSRYVPSTEFTRRQLNLFERIDLESSIDQMIKNAISRGLRVT